MKSLPLNITFAVIYTLVFIVCADGIQYTALEAERPFLYILAGISIVGWSAHVFLLIEHIQTTMFNVNNQG